MKCFAIVLFVGLIAGFACAESAVNSDLKAQTAASSLYPLQDKKQEKRYVGGYSGVGGYGGYSGVGGVGGYGGYGGVGGYGSGLDYSSRVLGLDAGSVYNPGYNAYNGYGGYGGYSGAGYGGYSGLGGYNGYSGLGGYGSSYSTYHGSGIGGYPYNRFGYGGYNSYPSSYYPSNYANSVVGGGLGGLGTAGFVPPVGGAIGSGYQYGPGISGSIY